MPRKFLLSSLGCLGLPSPVIAWLFGFELPGPTMRVVCREKEATVPGSRALSKCHIPCGDSWRPPEAGLWQGTGKAFSGACFPLHT